MAGNIVQIIIAAKDLTAKAFATTNARITTMKTGVGKIKQKFANLGTKISGVMSAAIVPIMLVVAAVYAIGKAVGSVITSFSDFKTAMIGVQKTTGMSDKEIKILGDEFKGMSKTVPLSAEKLADIGRVAGQLGITGVKDIKSFTNTVAEASVAFGMDAEGAAIGLAALTTIYDKSIPEAVNLGSAVNEMGNTTAASETQMLDFATSLGPTAKMLGFNAAEALGMGATLISMKMDASDAGTRLNSAFTMMGQKIPKVAEFLGISEQSFKDAFGEDPFNMLTHIIDKLKEIDDPLDQNTQATALFGRIGAKAIKGLMGDTEGLKTNVENATGAMEDGTAMHEEYLIFASSFQSQMELMKNKVNLVAVAIGEKLAPAILSIGTGFTDTVMPAFAAFSEEIGKQTSETWPKFKEAVNDAFAKITGGVTFQTMMEGMGAAIGLIINAILLGLTWIIDKLDPVWRAFGKGVGILSGFLTDIKNLGFGPAIVNLFETMKTEVLGVLNLLKTGIVTIFSAIKTAILDKLSGIKDKIVGTFEDSKTAIETAWEDLPTTVGGVLTTIGEKIKTFGEKIPVLGKPISSLGQLFIDIGPVVTTALTGIKTKVSEKFAELPTLIGNIFINVGEKITAFGNSLPDLIGGGIVELGNKFSSIGDSFKTEAETINADINTDIITPLSVDVPSAIDIMKSAMDVGVTGMMKDLKGVQTETGNVETKFENVVPAIDGVGDATGNLQEDVENDMDKVTIDVDGTKVTFDGLKGKVEDVVDEFGNFEDIAGELIGLDWSVFTTLKEQLPYIDDGIGDMKTAFEGLKKVLDDNIDNLADIKTDLGSIEKTITPFVNDIAPGITAIGNFASALSETQSALSTFASMSTVDLKGMFNFSTAVHSMVSGLRILKGQIGNLMPSFGDMQSLIGDISRIFVKDSKYMDINSDATLRLGWVYDKLTTSGISAHASFVNMYHILSDLGYSENEATKKAKELNTVFQESIDTTENREEAITKFINSEEWVSVAITGTTLDLKAQTTQLTKISDAIQPLIGFLQTLGTLLELTVGEDAIIPDLVDLQDAFASIERTMLNLGTALQTVDLAAPITQVMKDSEGFRTSMEENGGELALLMNYIDVLMGFYIDLAEQMVDIGKLQEEVGESGLDLGAAFGNIKDYIEELTTFTPILATALGALKTVWDENSGAINDGMGAFSAVMSAIATVGISLGDWASAENDAKVATEEATKAIATEADELAGHSLTTALGAATESSGIFEGATSNLEGVLNSLIPMVRAAANEISGSFATAASSAASILGSLSGSAYGWGSSLMGSFVEGIYSEMGALVAAMQTAAGIVNSYLGVSSPTEKGALAELEAWGPNLVRTFTEGIKRELPSLNKTLSGLSMGGVSVQGGMAGVAGSSSVKNVYMTVNQNISNREDARYAVTEIERLMRKPAIL